MTEKALILFIKNPEPGAVKTRLSRVLGDKLTLDIYRCFILDTIKAGSKVNADKFIIYSSEKNLPLDKKIPAENFECLIQRGFDLGSRMYNAFQDIFNRGYKKCTLIGSDIPDLPIKLINDSLDLLDDNEIVLGPSTDGGYYLFSIREDKINYGFFDNINWGTKNVLKQTIKKIIEKNLSLFLLSPWYDIDDIYDLKEFYKRNEEIIEESDTMKLLKKIPEVING